MVLTREKNLTECVFNPSSFFDGSNLLPIVNLGMHSYADTFIPEEKLRESEPIFPLQVGADFKNGLFQNLYLTNPGERYNLYDYSYTSSNSNSAKVHWSELAQFLNGKGFLKNRNALEIGSNDGYLLGEIKKFGGNPVGVDASSHMSAIASESGLHTINAIFGGKSGVSKEIYSHYGKFDLVIANNVFNHSNDPIDFMEGVIELLEQNGYFVFEVPYWKSTIKDLTFDQIYHEHVTYFTAKFVDALASKYNLKVVEISLIDYHGGSLRVILQKSRYEQSEKIESLVVQEEEFGLYSQETYADFAKKLNRIKYNLNYNIYSLHKEQANRKLIAVGAAAKANTFLTYMGLNSTNVDFITDSSQQKIGKYTPLTRIPIKSDAAFSDLVNPIVLITAWNLTSQLTPLLKQINPSIDIINHAIF